MRGLIVVCCGSAGLILLILLSVCLSQLAGQSRIVTALDVLMQRSVASEAATVELTERVGALDTSQANTTAALTQLVERGAASDAATQKLTARVAAVEQEQAEQTAEYVTFLKDVSKQLDLLTQSCTAKTCDAPRCSPRPRRPRDPRPVPRCWTETYQDPTVYYRCRTDHWGRSWIESYYKPPVTVTRCN